MSKYTTEVRFICENKAGMKESVGAGEVDRVIAASWNKIFTTKCTFFDETYRAPLCQKILKHYYLREIGTEVVGVWQLWMNTRLEEIMPYYNQLYKSALLEFEPFKDIDVTYDRNTKGNVSRNREDIENAQLKNTSKDVEIGTLASEGSEDTTGEKHGSGESSGSKNQSGTTTGSGNSSNSDTSNTKSLVSDTPQGGITNLEDMKYLTSARIDGIINSGESEYSTSETRKDDETTSQNRSDDETTSGKKTTSGSQDSSTTKDGTFSQTNDVTKNEDETVQSTEDYFQHITGKQSAASYSQRLIEFRETFLNIDMMVIKEFQDLFMLLW